MPSRVSPAHSASTRSTRGLHGTQEREWSFTQPPPDGPVPGRVIAPGSASRSGLRLVNPDVWAIAVVLSRHADVKPPAAGVEQGGAGQFGGCDLVDHFVAVAAALLPDHD